MLVNIFEANDCVAACTRTGEGAAPKCSTYNLLNSAPIVDRNAAQRSPGSQYSTWDFDLPHTTTTHRIGFLFKWSVGQLWANSTIITCHGFGSWRENAYVEHIGIQKAITCHNINLVLECCGCLRIRDTIKRPDSIRFKLNRNALNMVQPSVPIVYGQDCCWCLCVEYTTVRHTMDLIWKTLPRWSEFSVVIWETRALSFWPITRPLFALNAVCTLVYSGDSAALFCQFTLLVRTFNHNFNYKHIVLFVGQRIGFWVIKFHRKLVSLELERIY